MSACTKCGDSGRVEGESPIFRGWRYCDCVAGFEAMRLAGLISYVPRHAPPLRPVMEHWVLVAGSARDLEERLNEASEAGWTALGLSSFQGQHGGPSTWSALLVRPREPK